MNALGRLEALQKEYERSQAIQALAYIKMRMTQLFCEKAAHKPLQYYVNFYSAKSDNALKAEINKFLESPNAQGPVLLIDNTITDDKE